MQCDCRWYGVHYILLYVEMSKFEIDTLKVLQWKIDDTIPFDYYPILQAISFDDCVRDPLVERKILDSFQEFCYMLTLGTQSLSCCHSRL